MFTTPSGQFSVIIPTLNEADQLGPTLDSVVTALGASVEIVVVDGGSTDGTRQVVGDRARFLGSSGGLGRQLNDGALSAHGEVLLFLHADTWLDRDAGAALQAALERGDVVGGCFKVSLRGPTSGRLIARRLANAINMRSRWLGTATGDQAIFAKRSAFDPIGGFPELDLFEDVLFYRQLRRHGKVVILEPPVRTSDRRWRRRGYLRTITTHLSLRFLFLLGVDPAWLARLYRRPRTRE